MARRKLHVREGDTVVVISGKDKDKRGRVLKAFPREGKVLVEGVNMVYKHLKPSKKVPQGGIIRQEAPINAAKVMLVCPRCHQPTRSGKKVLNNGEVVRGCKRCGEVIEK